MRVKLGVKRAEYENGVTTGDVLTWNHFGTETIPPRPVLRAAPERVIPRNKERIVAYLKNLVMNPRDAKRLEIVLLTSLGQQAIAEAKRMIDSSDELQPNAPATVRMKGFDKPLYMYGTLRDNLAYEVDTSEE